MSGSAAAGPWSNGPPAPRTDDEIPAYVAALEIPGLADVHIHFHPDRLMQRIWAFFDEGERHYDVRWPIHYRTTQEERLRTLESLGVQRIPALTYAHRAGMAEGPFDVLCTLSFRSRTCRES